MRRFWEFKKPYYALIVATDEQTATTVYRRSVGFDMHNLGEISSAKPVGEQAALAEVMTLLLEDGREFAQVDLEEFRHANNAVLVIDGALA